LEEYYATDGSGEAIRFYLPVGRYIPEFGGPEAEPVAAPREAPAAAAPLIEVKQAPQRSIFAQVDDIVLIVLLVVVALVIAVAFTQILAPKPVRLAVPSPPKVAVAEFTSVAGGGEPGVSVAGLAVELVTDLDLFPYVDAVYLQRVGDDAQSPAPFELTGIARTEGEEVQITASLKKTGVDAALWSMTQKVPIKDLPDSLDAISGAFADQLGSPDGPLHADTVAWLDANPDIAGSETEYVCGLLFTLYRENGKPDEGARARSCVSGLMRMQPLSAAALSMNGTLQLDSILRTQPPDRPDPEPIADAERQIDQAIKLAPTSSPVWREYAFFLESVGRFGEAEAAFASALQLNPSNLDAVAGYARLLSLRGKSEKGETLATQALRRSLSPPYWYHQAVAVNALRDGDYHTALAQAEAMVEADAELASVIATVAAHKLGIEDVLNRNIAQLLEVTRFRRFGILPVLRQRLGDVDLRTEIGRDLAAAGIDEAALNGPS
jgi:hypothetical protein